MSTASEKSSREVEGDIEQTRARMTETLDALRSRMTPGQILDEVIGYAKDTGGGKMMHNLGRTIQDNPAPLLMIGAGIAWMMATNGSQAPDARHWRERPPGSADEAESWSDTATVAADSLRRTGEQMAEGVASVAGATADSAANLRDTATRRMHDFRDAAYQRGGSAYRRTRDASETLTNVLTEQPFVLGALGLALGAALGAALPETETEDNLMGGASDALKEEVASVATEGYETVKTVAEKTLNNAAKEAEAQGLTGENAGDLLEDIGSNANEVFQTAKETVVEEAASQGLPESRTGRTAASARPASSKPR